MRIFYKSGMSVEVDSFSPSASKGGKFTEYLLDKFPKLCEKVRFHSASNATFTNIHDGDYLIHLVLGMTDNGFGNTNKEVFRAALKNCQSMAEAAVYAFNSKSAALSPTSGFHHARWGSSGGFCTLNGLLYAAKRLITAYPEIKISIIDADYHYGDGTDDIIGKSDLFGNVKHYSVGRYWTDPDQADQFMSEWPDIVQELCEGTDLILYQAGADAHIDDPLGGFLTSKQLEMRDFILFFTARSRSIGVAWNLAGGYQTPIKKVLDIHLRTARAAILSNIVNSSTVYDSLKFITTGSSDWFDPIAHFNIDYFVDLVCADKGVLSPLSMKYDANVLNNLKLSFL